jgi:antitoxin ParD1/3/4
MVMIKKSVTVTDAQNEWIQSQLSLGNYASDSELLRDLIRKEQARLDGIEAIRSALLVGEKSGISTRNVKQIMSDVLKAKSIDADL